MYRVANDTCSGVYVHCAGTAEVELEEEAALEGQEEVLAELSDQEMGPAALPITARCVFIGDEAADRHECKRLSWNARSVYACLRIGKGGSEHLPGCGCDRHLFPADFLILISTFATPHPAASLRPILHFAAPLLPHSSCHTCLLLARLPDTC